MTNTDMLLDTIDTVTDVSGDLRGLSQILLDRVSASASGTGEWAEFALLSRVAHECAERLDAAANDLTGLVG